MGQTQVLVEQVVIFLVVPPAGMAVATVWRAAAV